MSSRPTFGRFHKFSRVVALCIVVLVFASGGSTAPFAQSAIVGGRAVAHRADGRPASASNLPTGRAFYTNFPAGEPTLAVTKNGDVFSVSVDTAAQPVPAQVEVIRSKDGGRSWDAVSPKIASNKTHPISIDPYIYVDDATGRIFTIDLTIACSFLSFSDDQGESWTSNPFGCGVPINDHQTLFSGPPVSSPTVGYPQIVYYCYNNVATSACTKSLDGGVSFVPTGTPAFAAADGARFCGGLTGHGVAGADGAIYLPRQFCGVPMLAVSHDEGQTWTRVDVTGGKQQIATGPSSGVTMINGADPSVAVDEKGNLYYVFIDSKDRLPYLVVSRDQGATWGKPMQIGPPGLKEANLPAIEVGDPGKIAISYMGSENAPGPPFNDSYAEVTWNGYITESTTALSKDPLFYSATVNPKSDPLFPGRCGPGRCGTVLDFIDVDIAADGYAWASFVDACSSKCSGLTSQGLADDGLIGRLVGGPRLR